MTKNNILLLVGRDDWQKDEALNLALLNKLRTNNIEVVWEDPAAEVIHSLRKIESKFGIISKRIFDYHRTSASFNNRAGIAGV